MKKNELAIVKKSTKSIQVKDTAWNSLSAESQMAYAYDYKLFFEFISKDPKDVTASDVLAFIEDLEENNYKNSSINRKIASLSKMFKIMVLAGDIKINPVDALKQFRNISYKTSKNANIGLTMQDIKKAVKILKNSTDKNLRTILIIRMLTMSGLRISEFTAIKNNDIVDFDDGNKIINIVGKGKKERKIYIDNIFLSEIKEVYPDREDIPYLFYTLRSKRYSRKVLWREINKFFKKRINKNVHPHMLRHFYGTYKINVEKQDIKAVSIYMGHSDVSITLNAYVDTALDSKNSKIKI